jgi:hypothetical protein
MPRWRDGDLGAGVVAGENRRGGEDDPPEASIAGPFK